MAEKDVSPGLLKKIQTSFEKNLNSSKEASQLLKSVTMGTATYKDADKYAEAVGRALSDAFEQNLSSAVLPDGKMYQNIGEKVIEPMFREAFNYTSSAAEDVQITINNRHNIHLKSRKIEYTTGQADSIIGALSKADKFDDAAWVLKDEAQIYALTLVDDALERNVDFQGQNGYTCTITRHASANCCQWCADLEGEYEYPLSKDQQDVYRRHDNCRCVVDYDPGTHDGQVQDVWSKEWRDQNEADIFEDRKTYGKERTWIKNENGKYRKARR